MPRPCALAVMAPQVPHFGPDRMKHLAALAVQRPSLALLGAEPFRAAMEFARHKLARTGLVGDGDGHPVVIFPGLGTDGSSTAVLREHCRALGYDAFDWGRGFNVGPHGDLDVWLDALTQQVLDLLARHDRPATLIGWSLGGLYAREIGKLMAPRIRQVITIGTPFNADADHTNIGWLFRLLSGGTADMHPALSQRLRTPPPVRTTSIYSKTDGVVAWQTCVHAKRSRQVQDIEVDGSHLGMGWNRDVLDLVAQQLQRRPEPLRERMPSASGRRGSSAAPPVLASPIAPMSRADRAAAVALIRASKLPPLQ